MLRKCWFALLSLSYVEIAFHLIVFCLSNKTFTCHEQHGLVDLCKNQWNIFILKSKWMEHNVTWRIAAWILSILSSGNNLLKQDNYNFCIFLLTVDMSTCQRCWRSPINAPRLKSVLPHLLCLKEVVVRRSGVTLQSGIIFPFKGQIVRTPLWE